MACRLVCLCAMSQTTNNYMNGQRKQCSVLLKCCNIDYFGGIGDTYEIQTTNVKQAKKMEAGELMFITFKARCKKKQQKKENDISKFKLLKTCMNDKKIMQ